MREKGRGERNGVFILKQHLYLVGYKFDIVLIGGIFICQLQSASCNNKFNIKSKSSEYSGGDTTNLADS